MIRQRQIDTMMYTFRFYYWMTVYKNELEGLYYCFDQVLKECTSTKKQHLSFVHFSYLVYTQSSKRIHAQDHII